MAGLSGKDGKSLYYRGPVGEVVRINVTTGVSFSIGQREVMLTGDYLTDSSHPNWDVAPDGRFLMLKCAGAEAQTIVVHNWGRELRKKTGPRKQLGRFRPFGPPGTVSTFPVPMSQSARFIEKWKARRRTAPGRLEVIPDVESRELGNRRDILVYLPSSYEKSVRPYPVLYLQDGQNLFDPATSFAGEWGVDSALARAPRKGRRAIIVGIPNAGIDRISEYSPFIDARIGGGQGDAYLDWVEQTVKPLIDARYRTQRGPEGTGMGGSSLGGLISLYAFFRQPARYGFAAILSPALWFGDRQIFRFVESAGYVRGRIYLDVGTREGEGTLANAREMRDLLLATGYQRGKDLMWIEDKGGMHNEAAWGRRLRKALPFLLAGT